MSYARVQWTFKPHKPGDKPKQSDFDRAKQLAASARGSSVNSKRPVTLAKVSFLDDNKGD